MDQRFDRVEIFELNDKAIDVVRISDRMLAIFGDGGEQVDVLILQEILNITVAVEEIHLATIP